MKRSVILVILDGWGYSPERRGNAIALARTPTFDMLERTYPFGYLQASGISVGLPWNEPGNSEVGHLALGTGRIVDQALSRIEKAIQNNTFFQNPVLREACNHVKRCNSSLHLAGLFGSGSVHSYLNHLHALLEFAEREKIDRVFLHLFLDGRDSPPKEGASLLANLLMRLEARKEGTVSTVIGRHYALDRTLNWNRTAQAYNLIAKGEGTVVPDLVGAVEAHYARGITDEFMEPLVSTAAKEGKFFLHKDDALVFFEFREDSARQITYCFAAPEKVGGFLPDRFSNLFIATMTEYEKGLPVHVIFPAPLMQNTLSELISRNNKKQFKIAETEKYAHLTYFFNGGVEEAHEGEIRRLITSEEVVSFDRSPEMQAVKISKELQAALHSKEYAFLAANFANADMVGHTGNLKASIQAIETIDSVMAPLVESTLAEDAAMVITADHGNAEMMINLITGARITEHSPNPVPFYIVARELKGTHTPTEIEETQRRIHGVLPDITATILELMEMDVPLEMQGRSLLLHP